MNLITVNNLTPDSACRTFFSNDIHFASFSNAVLFDGKQLIHPERLVRYENDISFIINDTKSVEDKKKKKGYCRQNRCQWDLLSFWHRTSKYD